MASSAKGYDIQLKLLTLGNSGVGKTCLLLRFSNDTFSPTFITTIGVDFKNRIVNVGGKRVKLQVSPVIRMCKVQRPAMRWALPV